MATEVYTEFLEIPKEYVLVNPTDENIEFSYDGETRTVPAHNVVVKRHAKYDDVPCSAFDENGEQIPGTLLLKDIYSVTDTALGGKEREWNAADAIKHTLGIDPKTGSATGKYASRGLTVAPRKYNRAVIEKLKQDRRAIFEQWRLKEANDIIQAHDGKNAIRQNLGMMQMPGDEAYRKAMLLVTLDRKRQEKFLTKSMSVDFNEEATEEQGPAKASIAEGFDALSPEEKKALVDKMMADKDAQKIINETHYIRPLSPGKAPVSKKARAEAAAVDEPAAV